MFLKISRCSQQLSANESKGILHVLNIERAFVVSVSMGVHVGLMFSVQHP